MPASPPDGWRPLPVAGPTPAWSPNPAWSLYDVTPEINRWTTWDPSTTGRLATDTTYMSTVQRRHSVRGSNFEGITAADEADAFVENAGADDPVVLTGSPGALYAFGEHWRELTGVMPIWFDNTNGGSPGDTLTESAVRFYWYARSERAGSPVVPSANASGRISANFKTELGTVPIFTDGEAYPAVTGGWTNTDPAEPSPPANTDERRRHGSAHVNTLAGDVVATQDDNTLRLRIAGIVGSYNSDPAPYTHRTWKVWALRIEVCSSQPVYVPGPIGGWAVGRIAW